VFDFDGVLVDSNAVKREAYVRIFAERGVPRDLVGAVLANSADADRHGVIARIVRRAHDAGLMTAPAPDLVPGLVEAYNAICEEHTATCAEVRGVSTVLPRLAGRYALYVASDTPEAPLRRVVERRRWTPYFRDVLGRPRTKAENLASILAREDVAPDAVVMIGDSHRDLAAARQCGCRFVGIRSDGNDFSESALLMLDDVSRLDTVIAALGQQGAARC
jgi:phosphoglycolate phosphatase-like HAD superfamily hydrolase